MCWIKLIKSSRRTRGWAAETLRCSSPLPIHGPCFLSIPLTPLPLLHFYSSLLVSFFFPHLLSFCFFIIPKQAFCEISFPLIILSFFPPSMVLFDRSTCCCFHPKLIPVASYYVWLSGWACPFSFYFSEYFWLLVYVLLSSWTLIHL